MRRKLGGDRERATKQAKNAEPQPTNTTANENKAQEPKKERPKKNRGKNKDKEANKTTRRDEGTAKTSEPRARERQGDEILQN